MLHNRAKQCLLGPNDPVPLELRVTSSLPINMPRSTSMPLFNMAAITRSKTCDSEQCLLMRTTQPRMDGVRGAGEGLTEIAVGRYNCDGTRADQLELVGSWSGRPSWRGSRGCPCGPWRRS